MISPQDPLAEVLVDAGVITREQLEAATAARANSLERLDETITRLGLARETDIDPAGGHATGAAVRRGAGPGD